MNHAVKISFAIVHSLNFSSQTIPSFVVYLVTENGK